MSICKFTLGKLTVQYINIALPSDGSDAGLANVRDSCVVTGVPLRLRKTVSEGGLQIHRAPTNTATGSSVSTAHHTEVPEPDEREGDEDYSAENGDEEEDALVQPPPTELATRATSGVPQGANMEGGDNDGFVESLDDDSATPIEADGEL